MTEPERQRYTELQTEIDGVRRTKEKREKRRERERKIERDQKRERMI